MCSSIHDGDIPKVGAYDQAVGKGKNGTDIKEEKALWCFPNPPENLGQDFPFVFVIQNNRLIFFVFWL